jgi:hypothetical protein
MMPIMASVSPYPAMMTAPAHWGGACGKARPEVIMTCESGA